MNHSRLFTLVIVALIAASVAAPAVAAGQSVNNTTATNTTTTTATPTTTTTTTTTATPTPTTSTTTSTTTPAPTDTTTDEGTDTATTTAEDTGEGTDTNETDLEPPEAAEGYELAELEASGQIRESSLPSLRVLDSYTAIWALNYDVGLTESFGKESSKEWLEPGATIHRNQMQFQGNFPYDGEIREYELKLVYYHPDTRQVEVGNTTTTQRFANVTGVDHRTIEMSPGFQSTANVTLRSHYDNPEQVAIFLLDDDGDTQAKWGPYTHDSVETTAGLPFTTWGGFLPWQIQFFLLPVAFGGAIAVGGGVKFARETGGWGKGIAWWAILSLIFGGIALMIWYADIVTLVVLIPPLLAVPVVFGLFVVTVEIVEPTLRGRIEWPNITNTESAVGESRPSIEGEKADSAYMYERDEGLAFINYGSIRAALARWVAGMAIVPWDRVHKRYKNAGSAPDSEKLYVESFEFEPAHWTYDYPELKTHVETDEGGYVERWRTGFIAGSIALLGVGVFLGQGFFNAPYIGGGLALIPPLATGFEPHRGDIDIAFAPGASISAKAARITESEAKMKYTSIDELMKQLGSKRSEAWRQVLGVVKRIRAEEDHVTDQMYEAFDGEDEFAWQSVATDGDGETDEAEVKADGG